MIVLWIFVGFLGGILVSALISVGKNRIGGNESVYKPYHLTKQNIDWLREGKWKEIGTKEQRTTTGYWSVADTKQDCTTDYTKYIDNSVTDTTIDKDFSYKGN